VKHVLVVYYSQSGEVERVAQAFASRLTRADQAVTLAPIRPREPYPYPWRSIRRFFDTMPECVLGEPPPIDEPPFDPDARFDLILLVYPAWFLSPAPPIQALFKGPHAAVFRGTDTVTVLVCRAMWQQASERMKALLAGAGAIHCDNAVVTHQGSALLTLISTPRALLFGKGDSLMGLFPKPGVADDDLARVERLAGALSARLGETDKPRHRSYLAGEPAIRVKRWLIVPELLGWYAFYGWALAIQRLGHLHARLRSLGVYGFALFLVVLILVALPVVLVGMLLGRPFLRERVEAYARRLAQPTGEAA
jgi:hypothetical protein